MVAKQAATRDSLSEGRLVLGLAVGGREDDFAAAGSDFEGRGRTFDRQLDELTRLWRGEGGVGPAPARERPGLLIGGQADIAFERAARYGDGWTMGGGTPDMFAAGKAKFEAAWRAAGREGDPRAPVLCYYALGDDAEQVAREKLGDYYAFLGGYADMIVGSAAKDAETVRAYLAGFEQAGADEVIFFPASPDPAQVELLADAAGLRRS